MCGGNLFIFLRCFGASTLRVLTRRLEFYLALNFLRSEGDPAGCFAVIFNSFDCNQRHLMMPCFRCLGTEPLAYNQGPADNVTP